MSEYSETCHYEMKDKARKQYKKDMPHHTDKETLFANVMADFDGKGYVSTYPINCIQDEIIYSFSDLKGV